MTTDGGLPILDKSVYEGISADGPGGILSSSGMNEWINDV
jgi:hypothetical protein